MTHEEGRGMVVAEGAMMDSVSETTETRPKGRVLQAHEVRCEGDLGLSASGIWEPTTLAGLSVPPELVGRYIRPEPETPAEPSGKSVRPGWRILSEGETLQADDEFQHHGGRWARVGPQGAGCVVEKSGRHRRRVEAQPSPGTATQPAPTPAPEGATPIVDLVIADLRARAEVGLRTYGTLLHAHNGRRADIDALQEACDQAMYLRQLVAEIDDARRALGASEGETLVAAAERVVRERQNVIDERDAARTWRRVETSDLVTERDRAWGRLASAERELERHRHGVTIEGDFVCPDSLALTETKRQLDAVSDVAGFHEREATDLRAKLASAERERDDANARRDMTCAAMAMLGSEIAGDPKIDPLDRGDPRWTPSLLRARDLRAKLAEAEERARRAEGLLIERDAEIAVLQGDIAELRSDEARVDDLRCPECEAFEACEHGEPKRVMMEAASDLARELAAREAQAPSGATEAGSDDIPTDAFRSTCRCGLCVEDARAATRKYPHLRTKQAPSGEPLSAKQAAVAAKMRERATPTTSMLATTTVAPSVTAHCACGRVFVDDVVAGLAKTTEHGGVLVCGTKPEDYDATAESVDGRCPHCGAVGQLEAGYGLAAGGCGAYSICMACERLCDSVQDEDDEPSGEGLKMFPAEPAPVEASEPEALRVLRTWCALDPGDRRSMIDEVATYVVGGSVAVEVLDAAPEVLRLYDAARAEVAALTTRLDEERKRHGYELAAQLRVAEDRHHATLVVGLGLADDLRDEQETAEFYRMSARFSWMLWRYDTQSGPLFIAGLGLADELRATERARDAWFSAGKRALAEAPNHTRAVLLRPVCATNDAPSAEPEKHDPVHAPTGDLPPVRDEAPRVEDVSPAEQDAKMAPWRGVPRQDEKGRWVLK